jgi:hypothetical protein
MGEPQTDCSLRSEVRASDYPFGTLRRVSAGSGTNGLGDYKLEEPSRELPTGLGIDPRDLSAYDHFLQVNKRILHHHQVAFVLPTPP